MNRRLRASWADHAARIDEWKARILLPAKRVIFTEAGYKSIRNSVQRPYAWRSTGGIPVDLALQREAYSALLSTMSQYDWFKGVYWWSWEARGLAADGDRGYSPQHKPAEEVVRYYYTVILRQPVHVRLASFEGGTAGWMAVVPLRTLQRPARAVTAHALAAKKATARRKVAAAKRVRKSAAAKRATARRKAAAGKRRSAQKKSKARTTRILSRMFARWTPAMSHSSSRLQASAAVPAVMRAHARAHTRAPPQPFVTSLAVRRPTDVRPTAAGFTSMGATHGSRALRLRRYGDGRRWDATVLLSPTVSSAVAWAAALRPEGPTASLPMLEMDVTFAPRPEAVWGPRGGDRSRGRGPVPAWAGLNIAFASSGGRGHVRSWAIRVASVTAAMDGSKPMTRHVAMPLRAWRSLRDTPRRIRMTVGLDGRWGGPNAPLTVLVDNVCLTRKSRIPSAWA